MTVNLKRGGVFAAVCAAAGFLFVLVPLFWQTPLCRPGVFLLAVFLDVYGIGREAIGHGAIWLIGVTNPVVYGAFGFLAGACLPLGRRALLGFAGGVGIVWFAGLCLQHGPRWYHHWRLSCQIRQAKEQLEAAPNDVTALYRIGQLHRVAGRKGEAVAYYRKIVELEAGPEKLSPEAQASLLDLTLIYQSWGDDAAAEQYYERFLASEPDLEGDPSLRQSSDAYIRERTSRDETKIAD